MASHESPGQDPLLELELKRKRLRLQAEAARLAAEEAELEEEIARAKARQVRAAPVPVASVQVAPAQMVQSHAVQAPPPPHIRPAARAVSPTQIVSSAATPTSIARAKPIPVTPVAVPIPAQQPTTPALPSAPPPAALAPPTEATASAPAEVPAKTMFRPSRLLAAVPSWAVSAFVHMTLVFVLAFWMVPIESRETLMVFYAAYEELVEEPEELQEVRMAVPTNDSDERAAVLAPNDVGAAEFGQTTDISQMTAGITTDEIDIGATAGDFGQLFGSQGKGMDTIGQQTGGAEFFGVKASGSRFVFIVDSSTSMTGTKFEQACEELMYSIRRLSANQSFYVIFFDIDSNRMSLAGNGVPDATFARATVQNINKLDAWVKGVPLGPATNPYDSVVFADKLVPDAIYLLTDGVFQDNGRSEQYLRDNNLFRDPEKGIIPKAAVHTICFYDDEGQEPLKRIAATNGGTYRYVNQAPVRPGQRPVR